ncbi:uncharacterized protein MONOS_12331 [Monocercomonoides exilis]|uniref:uncharacterized protein n=1 Tax=Monocercomonoides exilis TaxID=2049356 RepID=UPI00355A0937|nr:hypothetical protein MONOS_12331 [Monocercomonoides exilis]|eukprot:MONOS_12331.1-p1 / transcript=MONOS_12331.1 / gene=MONOS_12331 / organism=Monocercomonoides_exilis_PA203 / gene_product=unspecified product / transcript_product=unspecified product / location=Mono_scaffold00677:5145-5623(+) / protein_length=140 / sequence_SO=supercontig / SO=protein_coding / is_pseudo=false
MSEQLKSSIHDHNETVQQQAYTPNALFHGIKEYDLLYSFGSVNIVKPTSFASEGHKRRMKEELNFFPIELPRQPSPMIPFHKSRMRNSQQPFLSPHTATSPLCIAHSPMPQGDSVSRHPIIHKRHVWMLLYANMILKKM